MEYVEAIPNSTFEYRPPTDEVRRQYPNLSFPFTPTWGVFAIQDGVIVIRVMDQVTKNSALVFYQDLKCQGVAVTDWAPMSSNGGVLVMMKSDHDNDSVLLRVFGNSQELIGFLEVEGNYCSVMLP